MPTSILLTVKEALGVASDFTGFDNEIILGINTSIMSLTQIGVGPDTGLIVVDENASWADLIADATDLEAVKSYIQLKTRLLFDPPTGSLLDAMERRVIEMEWRLAVQVEPPAV